MEFIYLDNGNIEVQSPNGKIVGWINRTDTDGEYVFKQKKDNDRVWSEYMMTTIGHKLSALNNDVQGI